MYVHATLELSYGGVNKFLAIAPRVKALMEAQGVKMVQGMIFTVGRLNTVVHIWKMRDMNHWNEALGALQKHPDFPEIWAALSESVVDEKLAFAVAAPHFPDA
jgi:hypothetical protein